MSGGGGEELPGSYWLRRWDVVSLPTLLIDRTDSTSSISCLCLNSNRLSPSPSFFAGYRLCFERSSFFISYRRHLDTLYWSQTEKSQAVRHRPALVTINVKVPICSFLSSLAVKPTSLPCIFLHITSKTIWQLPIFSLEGTYIRPSLVVSAA